MRSRLLLGVVQNLLKARLIKGFQQVSKSVHIEGADRVLIESGNKHNSRQRRRNLLDHFEAVKIRHLHVEQKQIRMRPPNPSHRVLSIGGFANHFHFQIGGQKTQQLAPRRRFVIHHENAQSRHAVANCKGMRTETVSPPPGLLSKRKVWRAP